MTLDVTIGKIVIAEDKDSGRAYLYIKQCPNADFDVCDPTATFAPRESYRSGSSSFWSFWKKNDKLGKIYEEMRDNLDSNDQDVTFLTKYKDAILSLNESMFQDPNDKDRLKWLKYWTKKAIKLYGKKAGIMFS